MTKPKIAVTGASGFLGSNFIRMFSKKYDIVAIGRTSNVCQTGSVRVTDYSLESLQTTLKGCDAILHLAARRLYDQSDDLFVENVKIDHNIFLAAKKLGIENIVFASSRGVYGNLQTPWKETTCPKPNDFYALAKRQSEIAAEYFNRQGMKIKVLRIAQIFGIGEYKTSAISTFFRKASRGEPIIISVKGIEREYLYVKDACYALDHALNYSEEKGIYNVGLGETISLEKLARIIASAFGYENLVQIHSDFIIKNEKSLMDSSLFCKRFNWKPIYSLQKAANEIVEEKKFLKQI